MADAYANSIMVDALIHGREGTAEPADSTRYAPDLDGNELDNPEDMERWEPWVRAYTALGEALQGIVFSFKDTPKEVSVSFVTVAGAGLAKKQAIATIDRPTRDTFGKQLDLVESWAELRNERATEIMAQIDPQYAFWSSVVYLHPSRTRWTFELINVVLQFCVYVEMRFKHALGCWRPVEYNAQVQPMITTPGHGAFPSGHSTQAHAVAHVIGRLLNLDGMTGTPSPGLKVRTQLELQAARIATNRVVAGVHFPADSMAGRMLGVALGEFFVARCGEGGGFNERKFRSAFLDAPANQTMDFNPFDSVRQNLDATGTTHLYELVTSHALPTGSDPSSPSGLLGYLWGKAKAEWSGHFGR